MNHWQHQLDRRRAWQAAGLAAGLWLLLLAMTALAAPQVQTGDTLDVDRAVDPTAGLLGEVEFAVSLTLRGLPDLCPEVSIGRPQDIVLVLDRSSSMLEDASQSGSATKLELLKEATKAFVSEVDLASDRVAIVQFDDGANIVQGLSSDQAAIERAIDSIDYGGGTSIESGILQAFRELQSNDRPDAGSTMIVFTDGRQGIGLGLFNLGLIARAQEAKDAGVRVVTVGLGRADLGEVDADLLRELASQASDAYLVDDADQLVEVYETIARSVVQQAAPATDVIVDHRFDATNFELVANSIRPNTGAVSGNRISWAIPQILESPVTLSYRVRPLSEGTHQVDVGDVIAYNLCGETPQEISLPAALPVSIQVPPSPTSPPTNTPTPVPTPSVTPTPSPTPAPTWTPTPTPGPEAAGRATMNRILCDTSWLNWLFIILLLLFFLWWLWQVYRAAKGNREGETEDAGRRGCVCRLCKWILWLLVPLTLILLWSILSRLDFCPVDESLYFWRIGGGFTSRGEIYVTDTEGLRPATEFAAASQGTGCVGCHAVSSSARRIAAISDSGVGPVVVYDLDGESVPIPPVRASYVAWSPDGSRLAIADDSGDILVLDVDSQQLAPLQGASDASVFETMPAWSADGQIIAFVRGQSRQNNFSVGSSADIYVIPASGGSAAPLPGASGDGFNYYPAFSPDGRWLAFTRHTDGSTTYAAPEAEIFLVPAAGGAAQRLAANDGVNFAPLQDVSNSWPTWSLDSTMLAFNSKRNDSSYDLFMTEIDENGNSGGAIPVPGASEQGVFEHLPFWGLRPEVDLLDVLLGLWPFLLLYLLLGLLYWLCKRICPQPGYVPTEIPPALPPEPLPPLQLDPLWQVAPTLIVGVGGTGRWTLTHLKKALSDAGFGKLPEEVRFALIDTSEREETNVYRDATGKLTTVSFAGISLDESEVLLLGPNLDSLIGQTTDAALAGWFPHDSYSGLPQSAKDLANGTQKRRPMARAGLISKLREGSAAQDPPADAARLWQFLQENCEAVRDRDGRLVRVVLIGSMAGGMSGTLSDLGYWIRSAGESILPDDGRVHLEGYFTTEGPFSSFVQNRSVLQVNTMAAARELQRFQLSAGLPYVMNYQSDEQAEAESGQEHLRQVYSRKLFDEIVLFGGERQPEFGPGKSNEPWATTFASMADVLALRLDRATGAGTNSDYRGAIQHDAETLQNNREQAIVSTAGSYVLRLPLVDILHLVHTRWARKLYHAFLMGDGEATQLSFNPADAGLGQTPSEMATDFLLGRWQGAPAGMPAAGNLVNSGAVSPSAVVSLAAHQDNETFEAYLREVVGLILNGSQDRRRLQRRAPQLGYATQFVAEVSQKLGQAAAAARQQAETAPVGDATPSIIERLRRYLDMGTPSQADWEYAAARLAAWQELSQRSYQSLYDVRRLLTDDERDGSGATVVPGLYAELNRRQVEAEARREQMEQVAVRRYLWSRPNDPDRDAADPSNWQDLAEEWYDAAATQLAHYLDRFRWDVAPDGSVQLSLITYKGQQPIRLDDRRPETVIALADELLSLAADATREVASEVRLSTVLPTVLSTQLSSPEVELAMHAWQVAIPSLRGADAPGATVRDYRSSAAGGIPEHIQRDDRFAQLVAVLRNLDNRVSNALEPTAVEIVGATDATALSLVRSYDLMPIWNTPEMIEAWRVYARNAGTQQARLAESPIMSTVFEAERAALEYERRFEHAELLNEDFRRLHPLIVFALQRPEVVEAYALALAAGWITVRDNVAQLQVPGQAPVELKYTARRDFHPLIAGLLQAGLTWTPDSGSWQALRQATEQPTEQTTQAWRSFINQYRQIRPPTTPTVYKCERGHPLQPGQKFCGTCGAAAPPGNLQPAPAASSAPPPRPYAGEPRVVQDLVMVAVLEAFHHLAGEAEWNKIIMPAARWA